MGLGCWGSHWEGRARLGAERSGWRSLPTCFSGWTLKDQHIVTRDPSLPPHDCLIHSGAVCPHGALDRPWPRAPAEVRAFRKVLVTEAGAGVEAGRAPSTRVCSGRVGVLMQRAGGGENSGTQRD